MAIIVSNLGSDGTVFGQTVSDKIGFFGTTAPIVKLSGTVVAAAATTPAITQFGFTSAQAGAILTGYNQLVSYFGSLGLITAG